MTKRRRGHWRTGFLPGLTGASLPPGDNERASDPAGRVDARHGTWLISTLALGEGVTRLAINRSADGFGWSPALSAAEERGAGGDEGIAFDKNWIACDNSATSPFYGRCYLVYTHSVDADMLAVRWSEDGGQEKSPGADIGARPAVGVFPVIRPNGDLVAVYLLEAGGFAIAASRSTDGGATWAPPARIATIDNGCAVPGFRASRSRRRTSTRPAKCGRHGTTASRRVCAGTRCSSQRRRTEPSGLRRRS